MCSLEDSRLPRDVSLSPTGMVGGVFAPADRFKLASQGQECLEFIVRSTIRQKARGKNNTHISEKGIICSFLEASTNRRNREHRIAAASLAFI